MSRFRRTLATALVLGALVVPVAEVIPGAAAQDVCVVVAARIRTMCSVPIPPQQEVTVTWQIFSPGLRASWEIYTGDTTYGGYRLACSCDGDTNRGTFTASWFYPVNAILVFHGGYAGIGRVTVT